MSSVVWLVAQFNFVGPFGANFPVQILLDGVHIRVHLLRAAIQLVPGWLTPLFQTPSFEAPGSSLKMTMEQIVQENYEKQEQQ
jgi:hypothetical protein